MTCNRTPASRYVIVAQHERAAIAAGAGVVHSSLAPHRVHPVGHGSAVEPEPSPAFLARTGTGSPTVVIDAGWGDWSASWRSWVQPDVAKTTRVCTYDRAGMGYSEAGALPRTAQPFAKELHTLLQNAGIPGPYLLVGHSLGGLPVREFAHTYTAFSVTPRSLQTMLDEGRVCRKVSFKRAL